MLNPDSVNVETGPQAAATLWGGRSNDDVSHDVSDSQGMLRPTNCPRCGGGRGIKGGKKEGGGGDSLKEKLQSTLFCWAPNQCNTASVSIYVFGHKLFVPPKQVHPTIQSSPYKSIKPTFLYQRRSPGDIPTFQAPGHLQAPARVANSSRPGAGRQGRPSCQIKCLMAFYAFSFDTMKLDGYAGACELFGLVQATTSLVLAQASPLIPPPQSRKCRKDDSSETSRRSSTR